MTAREFRRWLAKQGCTFVTHKGGSGHLTVIRGDRRSQLPMHGSYIWARGSLAKLKEISTLIDRSQRNSSTYSVTIQPDDNGTFLVTCSDLPEVTTFGEDEEDAVRRAADAIEEALAARIARREDIPAPSRSANSQTATLGHRRKVRLNLAPSKSNQRQVALPPLTTAKVELYRVARAVGMTKAELGRRLGWHAAQVDRLFDLRHRSQIEQIDQALRTMGKRLDVSVHDAA